MAGGKDELLKSLMDMLGENPEEKISAALKSIGVGEEKEEKKMDAEPTEEQKDETGNDLEALLKIGSLISEAGGEDERAQLLNALKPFLREEKRQKIDSAVKMLRLAKIAKAAGKTEVLKDFKL